VPDHRFTLLGAVLVFVGAGVGGVLRFGVHALMHSWFGAAFPWGTLIANVSGCLAVGVLMAAWAGPSSIREEYRLAVMVGVLGGYTTFSAFGRETMDLVQQGHGVRAAAYVAGSVALCLAAVWLGVLIGRRFAGGAAAPIEH